MSDARPTGDSSAFGDSGTAPVEVVVGGVAFAGEIRWGEAAPLLKVWTGRGAANEVFGDDKSPLTEDQLSAILAGAGDVLVAVDLRYEYLIRGGRDGMELSEASVRLTTAASAAAITPEAAAQWECDTHRGGCRRCPTCKRRSYCAGCYACGLGKYPEIAETAPGGTAGGSRSNGAGCTS